MIKSLSFVDGVEAVQDTVLPWYVAFSGAKLILCKQLLSHGQTYFAQVHYR